MNLYKKPPIFERLYKKPQLFGNIINIKCNLAQDLENLRKKGREENFQKNRFNHTERSQGSPQDIKIKLNRWKIEREKKRQQERLARKPPFIVGIVRHAINSPIDKINIRKKGKISTYKRSHQKVIKNIERKKQGSDNLAKNGETFAPKQHQFRPPSGLLPIIIVGDNVEIQAYDKSTDNIPNLHLLKTPKAGSLQTSPILISIKDKKDKIKHISYNDIAFTGTPGFFTNKVYQWRRRSI